MSPVSANSATTFLKLNTLRASANAVTSIRPTRKPLFTFMSITFCQGRCELLIGSIDVPVSPKPCRGAVAPAPELRTRVNGSPLNARKSMNALTSRSTLPSAVFRWKSLGTVSETEPTMLWLRSSSVGSGCSGGGCRSPVTWEICRADVRRYENGSEPVLREISKL